MASSGDGGGCVKGNLSAWPGGFKHAEVAGVQCFAASSPLPIGERSTCALCAQVGWGGTSAALLVPPLHPLSPMGRGSAQRRRHARCTHSSQHVLDRADELAIDGDQRG